MTGLWIHRLFPSQAVTREGATSLPVAPPPDNVVCWATQDGRCVGRIQESSNGHEWFDLVTFDPDTALQVVMFTRTRPLLRWLGHGAKDTYCQVLLGVE